MILNTSSVYGIKTVKRQLLEDILTADYMDDEAEATAKL